MRIRWRNVETAAADRSELSGRDLGFLKPSDFEVISIPKDNPAGAAGWYTTKAEYEAQLQKPLGCVDVVQP